MRIVLGTRQAKPRDEFSTRRLANWMTLHGWRNGPIEDIHAGKHVKLLPAQHRISVPQMANLLLFLAQNTGKFLALPPVNDSLDMLQDGFSPPFYYPSSWSLDEASSEVRDL